VHDAGKGRAESRRRDQEEQRHRGDHAACASRLVVHAVEPKTVRVAPPGRLEIARARFAEVGEPVVARIKASAERARGAYGLVSTERAQNNCQINARMVAPGAPSELSKSTEIWLTKS
jgi:hypothetical protein